MSWWGGKKKAANDKTQLQDEHFSVVGKYTKRTNDSKTISISTKELEYNTAYGSTIIPSHNNENSYTWILKIHRDGMCFGIGIQDAKHNACNDEFCNVTQCSECQTYGLRDRGGKYSTEKGQDLSNMNSAYGASDIVTMKLDLKQKTLSYFKNNETNPLTIFNNIATNTQLKYRLAVMMWDNREKEGKKTSVTIQSFTGNNFKNKQKENVFSNVENETETLKKRIIDLENEQKSQKCIMDEILQNTERINKEKEELNLENKKLKEIVNRLQHEKKEMELSINELKNENEKLKIKAIDISRFEEWDQNDILNWLLSIGGGVLKKYENIMKKELTESEMKGSDLMEIDITDIKNLGIKVFSERKMVKKEIEKLIQAKNDKKPKYFNEGASTAYM